MPCPSLLIPLTGDQSTDLMHTAEGCTHTIVCEGNSSLLALGGGLKSRVSLNQRGVQEVER